MSFLPQTTCMKCHRQYSALLSKCPHCAYPKPQKIRRPVEPADSAVRDTPAASRAAESINWQILFGAVILLAVIAAVLALVSSKVTKDVADNTPTTELPQVQVAATAVPTTTPEPTPEPTQAPLITSLSIQYANQDKEGFTASVGDTVQLSAIFYPRNAEVTVKWYSSDDAVATVDQTGLVTCVSGGDYCYIYAEVEGYPPDQCQVVVRD